MTQTWLPSDTRQRIHDLILLENPRFSQLTALLARYQNEVVKSGIAAMNQQLSFLSSLLLDQAEKIPDSAESARQAAQDISAIRTPIINADTTVLSKCIYAYRQRYQSTGRSYCYRQ